MNVVKFQIGLIDLLRSLNITADGIIGHSLGESACAYADGSFTAEETILSAWARGRSSLDVKLISGMMAAVGNVETLNLDFACFRSFAKFIEKCIVFLA